MRRSGWRTRPGVRRISPGAGGSFLIADRYGNERAFRIIIVTCQVWLLSARIDCAESLFHHDLWMAMERSHYMQASKTFVLLGSQDRFSQRHGLRLLSQTPVVHCEHYH